MDLLERHIFYRCLGGCGDLAAAKLLVIFIVLIFAAVVVTTDSDFPLYRIHRNVRIPLALPEDRGEDYRDRRSTHVICLTSAPEARGPMSVIPPTTGGRRSTLCVSRFT